MGNGVRNTREISRVILGLVDSNFGDEISFLVVESVTPAISMCFLCDILYSDIDIITITIAFGFQIIYLCTCMLT